MTGARVLAMAEDVPALMQMMPGGRKHPIDGVLHDNDTVNIGNTRLYARLTAGHTRGATTFTTQVTEGREDVRRRLFFEPAGGRRHAGDRRGIRSDVSDCPRPAV